MTTADKPIVTPDDPMIVLPPGLPKGWRIYSVQPAPSEVRMRAAARELEQRGLKHDWWIQGRGVFFVDCRADLDEFVTTAIEAGLSQPEQPPLYESG